MKTITTKILGMVLLAISVATEAQTPTATPAVPTATKVQLTSPARGNVNRWITLPGKVRALQEAMLFAKVSGYLKSIKVDKGDMVKAGATIAEIEVPELIADVARYRAEAAVAKAEYDRIQQAVQKAPDLVLPVDVDRAKAKFDVAKASLERNETMLAFTRITAPFPGIVTNRYADMGAFIPAATASSMAQTAAIVTLMNFSTVRVQVNIPESEASFVVKGQPVRVKVEGQPKRSYEGKVTRYTYALDDSSKTMLAEIELPNPNLELRPGMYASVQVGIEHHDNVLTIPVAALVMEKTNAFVFVVASGKAHKVAIKAGFNDGSKVEVQEGLAADQAVILVGKATFTEGQAIQMTEGK